MLLCNTEQSKIVKYSCNIGIACFRRIRDFSGRFMGHTVGAKCSISCGLCNGKCWQKFAMIRSTPSLSYPC